MTRPVMRRLIAKDLYLHRWMIAGAVAAGLVACGMMTLGPTSAYVGGISLICVLIVLNIFLVMLGVVQEKKDKVLLFVLSLPVSTGQYVAAKVVANGLSFVVPWAVLAAAGLGAIVVSPLPDGLVPFLATVVGYLLAYYCVLLAVALVTTATGWHVVTITAGNVGINFLIPLVLALPSVAAYRESPHVVWGADVAAVLVLEAVVGAAALGAALWWAARHPDLV